MTVHSCTLLEPEPLAAGFTYPSVKRPPGGDLAKFTRVDRRIFLARLGKGVLAMAVLGACSDDVFASPTAGATTRPGSTAGTTATTTLAASTSAAATSTSGASTAGQFVRVDLGFVSAYVVVRGSEAAVIDTGVAGSDGAIAAALGAADLGWDAVGHVILTHHHPDHVGSLSAVMAAATEAVGYIGQGDIDNVNSPRELTAVVEGAEVFGMEVIETPGHTAGHISLLDPATSVFIAGDALNGGNGGVEGPNPQFSEDHQQALATVAKIAGFTFETLYFGHGDPVLENASEQVGGLAASL